MIDPTVKVKLDRGENSEVDEALVKVLTADTLLPVLIYICNQLYYFYIKLQRKRTSLIGIGVESECS